MTGRSNLRHKKVFFLLSAVYTFFITIPSGVAHSQESTLSSEGEKDYPFMGNGFRLSEPLVHRIATIRTEAKNKYGKSWWRYLRSDSPENITAILNSSDVPKSFRITLLKTLLKNTHPVKLYPMLLEWSSTWEDSYLFTQTLRKFLSAYAKHHRLLPKVLDNYMRLLIFWHWRKVIGSSVAWSTPYGPAYHLDAVLAFMPKNSSLPDKSDRLLSSLAVHQPSLLRSERILAELKILQKAGISAEPLCMALSHTRITESAMARLMEIALTVIAGRHIPYSIYMTADKLLTLARLHAVCARSDSRMPRILAWTGMGFISRKKLRTTSKKWPFFSKLAYLSLSDAAILSPYPPESREIKALIRLIPRYRSKEEHLLASLMLLAGRYPDQKTSRLLGKYLQDPHENVRHSSLTALSATTYSRFSRMLYAAARSSGGDTVLAYSIPHCARRDDKWCSELKKLAYSYSRSGSTSYVTTSLMALSAWHHRTGHTYSGLKNIYTQLVQAGQSCKAALVLPYIAMTGHGTSILEKALASPQWCIATSAIYATMLLPRLPSSIVRELKRTAMSQESLIESARMGTTANKFSLCRLHGILRKKDMLCPGRLPVAAIYSLVMHRKLSVSELEDIYKNTPSQSAAVLAATILASRVSCNHAKKIFMERLESLPPWLMAYMGYRCPSLRTDIIPALSLTLARGGALDSIPLLLLTHKPKEEAQPAFFRFIVDHRTYAQPAHTPYFVPASILGPGSGLWIYVPVSPFSSFVYVPQLRTPLPILVSD